MDTQRLVLFMLFTFSVFFLYDAWQKDQRPPPSVAGSSATPAAPGVPAGTPVPAPTQPLASAPAASAPPQAGGVLQKGETVRVVTDGYVAEIDTAGGDLRSLELLHHRDTLDKKKNFRLLQPEGEHIYVAQSGLIGSGLPNHRTRYTASEREAKLAPGADSASVRLMAPAVNGVEVAKIYTFRRGSYLIDVSYEIANKSPAPVQADAYFQHERDGKPPDGDSAMLPTYTGVALYTEKEKFQQVNFGDIDKENNGIHKKGN